MWRRPRSIRLMPTSRYIRDKLTGRWQFRNHCNHSVLLVIIVSFLDLWREFLKPHQRDGRIEPDRLAPSERWAPGAEPRRGFKRRADAQHRSFIKGAADDLHRQWQT